MPKTSPATGKQAQRLVTVAKLGGGMDPMPPSGNKNPAIGPCSGKTWTTG